MSSNSIKTPNSRTSVPNMIDDDSKDDISDQTVDPTDSGIPKVEQRETPKTTFFDVLGITKIIKSNQEHAKIMAIVKRYKKLEKDLEVLNKKLDRLIELLMVATGGGEKSILLKAAEDTKVALSNYETFINNLNQISPQRTLTIPEITLFNRHRKAAGEKYLSFEKLGRKTTNYSVDLGDCIREVVAQKERLKQIHKGFRDIHPETIVPTN